MPDINQETGLPHKLTLADVFSDIELTPAEVGTLLTELGGRFVGGAHDSMGRTLWHHAITVNDPNTYKGQGPSEPQRAPAAQGQATTPPTEATATATPSEVQRQTSAPEPPGTTPAPPSEREDTGGFEPSEPSVPGPATPAPVPAPSPPGRPGEPSETPAANLSGGTTD